MEIPYLFSVLLLHCFMASLAMTAQNFTTDQFALLAFKAHITSDPQNVLRYNWSISNPLCEWIGISCGARHRRVTALNLSSMGLEGTIPAHIGNLSFLAYLDLGDNNFTGHLPSDLGKLRRLVVINLQTNKLSGGLPPEIGKLPNLEEFHMGGNQLSGSIPWTIYNISSLRKIGLSSNFFLSGHLPDDLCNRVPKLEMLDLTSNRVSGQIPSSIGDCGELQTLSLVNNLFTGRIPENMGNLSRLVDLLLSGNNLAGPFSSNILSISLKYARLGQTGLFGRIPADICRRLLEIEKLYLDGNHLSGSIPKDITNCTSLKFLSLRDNEFTGEIPHEIGKLQDLEYLFLGENSLLSGPIPPSLFNISTIKLINLMWSNLSGHLPSSIWPPNLDKLIIFGSKLSGPIPDSISNSSELSTLELSSNSLSGFIPNTFGNLRLLTWLNLGDNYLTTESFTTEWRFLSSLTSCRKLEDLLLGNNPLYGILPPSIGNFSTSLQNFGANSCKLMGSIPRQIGNLSSLISLDLSGNDLNGSIPTTVARLLNLQGFFMQNNNLQGSIPCDLCRLERLVDLQLSGNNLSGSIPFCMSSLISLRSLFLDSNRLTSTIPSSLWNLRYILEVNLSSNAITGSLPLDIQNLKVLISLDLSRNQLSGDIPVTIGGLNDLVNLSLRDNIFGGTIPESFGHLISLESLDLSNNNLSGEIPKSLEALLYLKYFNVSYNRLEGEIPAAGPFKNFSPQSFMWNYALCGPPLKFQPCKRGTTKGSKTTTIIVLKFIVPPIVSTLLIVIAIATFIKSRSANGPAQEDSDQEDLLSLATWRKISYLEIQRATDDFSEYNLLGIGAFGLVYKGKLLDETNVAIKVFNLELEKALRSFESECEVLHNIRHRNLIKIFSSCCVADFKALILEFMPNGSLEKWLYSYNNFLDVQQRLDIMMDVAFALEYLHHGLSTPVVHCDLKPSNVLLDENMVAHLSDFGVSKLLSGGDSMTQTMTLATIGYMAPEYGSTGIVSSRGDVYSFGILVMETFTRKKPTDEMFSGEMSLKHYVKSSLPHAITEVIDANLLQDPNSLAANIDCLLSIMDLALDCTRESAEQRINMKDVVVKLKKMKMKFMEDMEAK